MYYFYYNYNTVVSSVGATAAERARELPASYHHTLVKGMSENDERAPLLRDANGPSIPPVALGAPDLQVPKDVKVRPGPLDIPRANRYAILAGIWTATFLSVSGMKLVTISLSSDLECLCSL